MKREFALPAAFSATVLSFMFFGLPDTRSQGGPGSAPSLSAPPPKVPPEMLALEDPEPIDQHDDEEFPGRRLEGGVPRLPDLPPAGPSRDWFPQPPLPPVERGGDITVIKPDWNFGTSGTRMPSGPIDVRFLDREPRPRAQLAPDYPREMRLRHIEGRVVVEFVVDESGNVHSPVAVSATDTAFEEAALRAIAKWKFEPGYYHNRKVRFRMSVPVVFTISED